MRKKSTLMLLFAFLALFATKAGAQQTIIEENFDQFTDGSEDSPATTDISGYTGKLYTTLGWNGKNVYEAGGKLKIGDSGKLTTARLKDLSTFSTVKVTFDVKSPAEYGGACTVKLGYSQTETFVMYDNQWHSFSAVFDKVSAYSTIEFAPFLAAEGVLIDNVKVVAGDFLKAPVANQPRKATKTAFTAEWNRVSGAESYLLDVYTKDGDAKDYLLQDKEVTTLTCDVDGLDPAKTYFYTVRAKKGDVLSDASNEIEVVEVFDNVAAPTPLPATDVTAEGFTANWEAAANASRYDVLVTKHEVLDAEREVDALADNFSKVVEGTLSNPVYKFRETLDGFTQAEGWTCDGSSTALAAGFIGIAPISGEGWIQSPALDLSRAGGAFTVKLDMAEYFYETIKGGSEVQVRLYNGQTLKSTQKVTLEDKTKVYSLSFEGGTADSHVQIAYTPAGGASNKLFIDSLAISQNLGKGDKVSSFYVRKEVGNVTSVAVEAPLSSTTSYSYAVMAYARSVESGELTWISSSLSDTTLVVFDQSKPHYEGVAIDPAEGKVASLKNFELTFDKYQFVDIADDSYKGAARLINDATKEEVVAEVKPGVSLNKIDISLPEEVTAKGSYTLFIPSGKLYDGIDPDETDLPEYSFRYTIDGSVVPPVEQPEKVTANPADSSVVAKIDEIVLIFLYDGSVFPGSEEITVVDDATGSTVTTAKASVVSGAENEAKVTLAAAVTTDGKYTVKFPKGAFVKEQPGKAEKSAAFELHYTVDNTTGIGSVNGETTVSEVFRTNAAGQRMGRSVKGLNIVKYSDGSVRKVVVK